MDTTGEEIERALRQDLLARIAAIYPEYQNHSDIVQKLATASSSELIEYLELAKVTSRIGTIEAHAGVQAFLDGDAGADGEPIPADVLDRHDWRKYLLAKDMEPNYSGPPWVPFALWSSEEAGGDVRYAEIVRTLIHDPGARELWASIEDLYERPNNIATALPLRIREIFEHWDRISKETPSDHKTHMLRLKAHAQALATEIDRVDWLEHLLTGDKLDFMRLYTEEERKSAVRSVRLHNYSTRKRMPMSGVTAPESMTWEEYNTPLRDPTMPESPINLSLASYESAGIWQLVLGEEGESRGIVPPLPDLLRRLAAHFEEMAANPPLQRPRFANAERNFFARSICSYFRDSCGQASPAIVSRLVSMFFPQGITDNEVSQMLKQIAAEAPRSPEGSF